MKEKLLKIRNKLINKKMFPYYIIFIVTLLVGNPLLHFNTIDGHDLPFHLFRVRNTTMGFLDGQIIPMIDPTVANGLGYSWNMFYGILPTYAVALIKLCGITWTMSYNLFIFISIYLSGVFMYRFAKDAFKNNKLGLIIAVIYITTPYFLTDIYIRQALGEFMAFVFIPILFHGIFNLLRDDGKKFYYITIGTIGLIMSHNLSTLMVAIFAIIYLLLNIKKVFKKEIIKKLVISMAFAIGMSMIMFGPLLEAKSSAEYEVFNSGWMLGSANNMNGERLNFDRLLSSNLYKQAERNERLLSGEMPFDLGIPLVLSLFIFPFIIKKYKDDDKKTIKQFLMLGLIALALTSVIINWEYIPSIFYMFQFPWRFLLMVTFFLSIVSGCVIYKLFENFDYRHLLLVILICCVTVSPIIGYATYNKKVDDSIFEDNEMINNEDIGSAAMGSSEYFTQKLIINTDYIKETKYNIVILKGDGAINNVTKSGTKITFDIEADTEMTLELPLTFYPGYIANNDIKTFESEHGLVGIKVNSGTYQIEVRYFGTPIIFGSYIFSILTMVGFGIYVHRFKKKNKIIKCKDLDWGI